MAIVVVVDRLGGKMAYLLVESVVGIRDTTASEAEVEKALQVSRLSAWAFGEVVLIQLGPVWEQWYIPGHLKA